MSENLMTVSIWAWVIKRYLHWHIGSSIEQHGIVRKRVPGSELTVAPVVYFSTASYSSRVVVDQNRSRWPLKSVNRVCLKTAPLPVDEKGDAPVALPTGRRELDYVHYLSRYVGFPFFWFPLVLIFRRMFRSDQRWSSSHAAHWLADGKAQQKERGHRASEAHIEVTPEVGTEER